MKRGIVLALFVAFSFGVNIYGENPVGDWAPPPEAGIADNALQALGNKAEAVLLNRFADPANEKFREGLIYRMRVYGDIARPSEAVRKQLHDYVEAEVISCQGTVDFKRLYLIGSALEVIGQRGGPEGIKYLEKWVANDSFSTRINCYPRGRTSEYSSELLQWSAVIGLGLSADKNALTFLHQTAKNPPKVKYPGSLMGVINRAIAENTEIQKVGIRKFYEPTYDNINAYQKHSSKK